MHPVQRRSGSAATVVVEFQIFPLFHRLWPMVGTIGPENQPSPSYISASLLPNPVQFRRDDDSSPPTQRRRLRLRPLLIPLQFTPPPHAASHPRRRRRLTDQGYITPYFEDLHCADEERHMLTGIMVALSASTSPEVTLKLDSTIPRCFQRVMAAVASSSLRIGQNNRNQKASRAAQWFAFVFVPSAFIVTAAVVESAMWHVTLFLPRAPLAAWEALHDVGFEKIGVAVSLTCGPVLLFDQARPIVWSSLVCLLIAVIVAFWVCLVRAYGKS
uniref:DUF7378 domain-containing protein n=1 Tax=Setaria viridis TaxID=4556 RepID=A0A4U6VB88_SETVI|nr:hypothetical protein SEVIR_3G121700v2 [Setaria viridis]